MPTVLITGGHSGLGLEASREIASMGFNLILAGRDPIRIESIAKELRLSHNIDVTVLQLDVSSLLSVRQAAILCNDMLTNGKIDSLQAIICNAGASFIGKVSYSVDGYEMTFATNYLGHFLLIQLLVDNITDNGRIVFVASGTHDPDTRDGMLIGKAVEANARILANMGKDGGKSVSFGKRYATSKLCMILCAYELDRRLKRSGKSIASIAYDPGSIPDTNLMRGLPTPLQPFIKSRFMRWIAKGLGVTQGRLDFSGISLAKIATESDYAKMSGKYLQSHDGVLLVKQSSKASYDEAGAAKLWEDSRDLAHLHSFEEPKSL
ncbi:SDR family NAD(P)-dependent oxidoreductase [Pantoea cypripedii]|uniref:Short-chain dehydrogenase n=1 Tax=Pantoea cypripedii TaxID=55209 RepID=A0A6B9G6I8_PANCY|nr:SDR family NAD(P)-dependent oxidoreductase [Pantoea cypripedii]QGY33204.1 hypothetical protein CUN67_30305 [Pantoea cypripedii]